MHDIVRSLVRKCKTTCPFTIAKHLNIHVRFEDLGETTRGLYVRQLRRRFIVIHNQLSYEWQRFVCAHELGHDRLHGGIGRFFIEEHTFFAIGKYERQANQFAVQLLSHGREIEPGETAAQFCKRNGIPEEMVDFYG